MATAAEQKSESAEKSEQAQPRRKRSGRYWRWVMLLALLAVITLVWAAPVIVAHTELRQQILPTLLPQYPAHIRMRAASLDWFSPIELREVTFRDAEGRALLQVERFTSERTLMELAVDQVRIGKWQVNRPVIRLVTRNGGSNLEDAMLPLLESDADSSQEIECAIEIVDGVIEMVDSSNGRHAKITGINCNLNKPLSLSAPLAVQLSGNIDDAVGTGTFEADIAWKLQTESLDLRWNSRALSLEALQPLISRFVPNVSLSGTLDSDAKALCEFSDDNLSVQFSGNLKVDHPKVSAVDWLGDDRLESDRLQVAGNVSWANGRLAFDDFSVNSELAELNLAGVFSAKVAEDRSVWEQVADALRNEDVQLSGKVDLARLGEMLPGTLHIRDDLKLTSGELQIQASSSVENKRRVWAGKVKTTTLRAESRDRVIEWNNPIELTVSAKETDSGIFVEQFQCDSEFLDLTAGGNIDRAHLNVQCDLNRLTQELGRFVDLNSIRLRGILTAGLNCKRDSENRLLVDGSANVSNFEFTVPEKRPWREENLQLRMNAQAVVEKQRLRRLEQAQITLTTGNDHLNAELLKPVLFDDVAKRDWYFALNADGEIQTWLARVQLLLNSDGWNVVGNVNFNGQLGITQDAIIANETTATFKQLVADGPGLHLAEPNVRVQISGMWDRQQETLISKTATWASPSLSLRADDVTASFSKGGVPQIHGAIVFRGGLEPLSDWVRDRRQPQSQRFAGVASGQIKFAKKADTTTADWNLRVDDFTVFTQSESPMTGWQTSWQEPAVSITGRGSLEHQKNRLTLEYAKLSSKAVTLQTAGSVSNFETTQQVELTGEVKYNWKNLLALFRGSLGDDVEILGEETQRFTLKGPLADPAATNSPRTAGRQETARVTAKRVPETLRGQTGIRWDSMNLYGFSVGTGKLDVILSEGKVQIPAVDLQVGEGRVQVSPVVFLNQTPVVLVHGKGRVVENVRFSPEMCKAWLKYVAPILADTTRINGQFSMNLTEATVPLMEPRDSDITGTLTVHAANVKPGPLAQQFLQIARQVKTIVRRGQTGRILQDDSQLLKIAKQDVAFRMIDRRVHHRKIEFLIGDVTIRTSGSVGLDQTLELVAELPIREDWVGNNKLLSGLKGQTLRIPIRGTFDKPQVDQRVLSDLARRVAGAAAGKFLEENLKKQFGRLFGPRR